MGRKSSYGTENQGIGAGESQIRTNGLSSMKVEGQESLGHR